MDRIRDKLGSETETQFRYHCRECDTDFETTEQSRTTVACPECGSEGPRHISKL